MSIISNITNTDDSISFDLNNEASEIRISLANSIRRTIISDISTYTIDDESIVFYENNSMLNNEFLKDRLILVPIISYLENINYDNLVISCKKENNDENMENIYVSDFIVKDIETNDILDNNMIFKYPNILFGKIKTNQQVSFEAKLKKNSYQHWKSASCPVSQCNYVFKIDNNKVNEIMENMSESEKKNFLTQEVQRIYEKNKIGEPNVYQFQIESNGFYEPRNIVILGIRALVERLNNVKIEFFNTKSKKISVFHNDENPDFFNFLIDKENDTLGNILSTYLTYQPNVFYCGYVIEHPLNHNIILKIKLNENNNLENILKIIGEQIDFLINILEKMVNEFV